MKCNTLFLTPFPIQFIFFFLGALSPSPSPSTAKSRQNVSRWQGDRHLLPPVWLSLCSNCRSQAPGRTTLRGLWGARRRYMRALRQLCDSHLFPIFLSFLVSLSRSRKWKRNQDRGVTGNPTQTLQYSYFPQSASSFTADERVKIATKENEGRRKSIIERGWGRAQRHRCAAPNLPFASTELNGPPPSAAESI